MSVPTLILALAGGLAVVGIVARRVFRRRRNGNRRRLDSLGVVESHREMRPRE